MSVESFNIGDEVVYIPNHAHGDRTHKDCKWGRVSSKNDRFVFVRFNEDVATFGWDGATSQACKPENLER